MDGQLAIIGIAAGGAVALLLLSMYVFRRKKKRQAKHNEQPAVPLMKDAKSSDIILDTIDDGVLLIDSEGTIKIFNPGASKITGWQPDEAIGLNYNAVIKLTDDKNAPYTEQQDPFQRALKETATIRDSGATLISRSERYIPLSLTVSPLFDESQTVRGAVAVFRDVSKEREEETQRAEFISTASHEMRTPIAAIEGYLSLVINAKTATVDPKSQEYLTKAYDATKHLGKLFQDLLSSSQAEDGRLTINPVVIDIGMFLERLLQDLRFSADKQGLSVELVMGAEDKPGDSRREARASSEKVLTPLYYVQADPDRLREVISNLFDNAVKYTEEGKISVGLTGNSDIVQLYIRDSGVGIAPEDLPHLFQKFYRVDNSNTRTIGGTGLGLFISRVIIEQLGGRIWATSELGKGSTFFINLPRLTTQQAELSKKRTEAETIVAPTVVQ